MKTLVSIVVAAASVVSLTSAAAHYGRKSSVINSGHGAIHVQPFNTSNGNGPRAFDINRYLRQTSDGTSMGVRRVKASEEDYVLPCGMRAMLDPGASLVIQSKHFPSTYPKRQNCEWLIMGAELKVDCGNINIQKSHSCKKDSLYLQYYMTYEDESRNLCGKKKNFKVTVEEYLYAHFKTDRRGNKKGFSCRITDASEKPVATEVPPTSAPSSDKCHCGKINNVARIVGGEPTNPNKYPWQVGLVAYRGKKPFCGGSIINEDWILTASHCAEIMDTTNQVIIGEHNWKQSDSTMQRFDIAKIIVHKKYDPETVDYDIALLKLRTPISFPEDNKIAPICLPPANEAFENVKAVVSGWGALYSDGPQPNVLQEVQVTTITNKKCASKYAKDDLDITTNMLCAEEDGKDSCQGDSGGPLVGVLSNASQSTYQIGVVSWGIGCADDAYPGVYARVNYFLDWISEHTSGSKTCDPIQ